jgi:hypothetical protein
LTCTAHISGVCNAHANHIRGFVSLGIQSGFIDAAELCVALKARGVHATAKDVQQMIADADMQSAKRGDDGE